MLFIRNIPQTNTEAKNDITKDILISNKGNMKPRTSSKMVK